MTTLPATATAPVADRFNFAISKSGHYGVCFARRGEALTVESWKLDSPEGTRTFPGATVDRETCPLPLDDGRCLFLHRSASGTSGRNEVVLIQAEGKSCRQEHLGEIRALPGSYLLPSFGSAQLGYVVALDDAEHSTIWRVSATPPRIEPVMRVPGALLGGAWLDGHTLAINQTTGSTRASGIIIDLAQGMWRRIWSVSDASTDRIALYSSRSKLLIVSTNASGEERLGWARLGGGTVHFPEKLHRTGYLRRALALDAKGRRLLVHETAGAVSKLFVYTPADDRLVPLAGPPSTVSPPATWTGDRVRFLVTTPCQPPTLVTARAGARVPWSIDRDRESGGRPGWATAKLVEIGGPAGPIEAIVYGGPQWRRRRHLVLALHGGPLSSWRFAFEPLFQSLAMAGIAVVAPNYRGSTGYGEQHLRAVIGDWGGPDLDDVLHIGCGLEEERRPLQLPRPVILGASYGGFLALLASCDDPELWSACVALAPFLSARRLQASGGAAVRERTARLGGLRGSDESAQPRDVLRVCSSLAAPLLLCHGARDATVPVAQSRMLRDRLLELGWLEDADFEYLETADGHAEMVLAESPILRRRIVSFCLAQRGETPLAGSGVSPLWREVR